MSAESSNFIIGMSFVIGVLGIISTFGVFFIRQLSDMCKRLSRLEGRHIEQDERHELEDK